MSLMDKIQNTTHEHPAEAEMPEIAVVDTPPSPKKAKVTDDTSSTADSLAESESVTKNPFYTLKPLTKAFGAEVEGCDLKLQELSDEFVEQLKKDVAQHRLLLFKKQDLSGQKQVDISSKLGKVESTFYKHHKSPHEDIFRVSNDSREGCVNVGRSGWHVDGTFMETPFKYQTMYFPSVAEGGDTYFIPLKELYEAQNDPTKERWDRLWMITGGRRSPVHPLTYKHPVRGDTTMCFHCGEPFVQAFAMDNGIEPSKDRKMSNHLLESRPVQEELTEAIEDNLDDLGLKMKWEAGDFTINDNLGLAHYASPGTQGDSSENGLRVLHRTTVLGGPETVPHKADGRGSFPFAANGDLHYFK